MGKIQNMLLGIDLGDSFGAGYEFAKFEDKDISLDKFKQHPNPEFRHIAGYYTDDTQMSIAIAELLEEKQEFNRDTLADAFVKTYKRDPRVGYAKQFQAFLDSISSGEEFLAKINPNSERNGAAMRSVPLGMIKNPYDVIKYARINASLTHNTPKGIASSVAIAVMSHFELYVRGLPNIKKELAPILNPIDRETTNYLIAVSEMKGLDKGLLLGTDNKVPCDGMKTVGAVLYVLSNFQTASEILTESVRLRGDTDSVAAIALGLHMINAPREELPQNLVEKLANHEYGREYILELGRKLEDKFLF